MNHKIVKITAVILTITLMAFSLNFYRVEAAKGQNAGIEAVSTSEKEKEEALSNAVENIITKGETSAYDKTETVYVNADALGNTKDVIVSEWLKNSNSYEKLRDKSDLNNIVNIKGDETYEKGDNNEIVWNADGSDIYYQGETDKKLPVTVKVTYYLDDKEISPDKLAGKSGKVKIRFDYENNETALVNIDGKNKQITIPFAMVTGLLLPSDKFTNIEVNNGKVINDANNSIIIGTAFPGLKDSLDLEDMDLGEDFTIPDYMEITADVTDFSLSMTMTAAVSDFLKDLELDDFDSIDKLKDAVDELEDASGQLQEGTKEVHNGLSQLQEKEGTFAEGVSTITSKTQELSSGMTSLSNGSYDLNNGAKTLNENMQTLCDGASSAASGAAALASGYEGDGGAIAGAGALASGLTGVNDGMNQLSAGVSAMYSGLQASVGTYSEQLNQLLAAQQALQAAGSDLNTAQYEQLGQLEGTIAALQNILSQMDQSNLGGSIAALNGYTGQLAEGAASLSEGMNQLYNGTKELQTGLQDLSSGSAALKEGTEQLYTGTASLYNGAVALANGAGALTEGMNTLLQGTGALTDGIGKLSDGAQTLNTGMTEFKRDGINKISDTVDNKVTVLLDTWKAIVEAGNNYQTFTDMCEDMSGSVKFIIKTAEV